MICYICGETSHIALRCPNERRVQGKEEKVEAHGAGESRGVSEDDVGVPSETLRKRVWRANNRDAYNRYQREYMREYRARG